MDHLLRRETIIDEVSVEALECNHLIGHENTILDMVVDILITFPHQIIQEFMGNKN